MKKSITTFIILLFTLIVCSINNTAFAEKSLVQNDYDYAKDGDLSYNSADVVGVLENLLGANISDIEKKYLLLNGGLSLTYSDSISISNVSSEFDGTKLSVSALPYSYKAINARTVTWNPVAVNGNELSGDGSEKSFVFNAVDDAFGDSVKVEYEAMLPINYKDINKYVNYVYSCGQNASAKLEQKRKEYEDALFAYSENLEKYNDYLDKYSQYLDAYEEYRAYLVEYSLWQDKMNAYSRYLSEYDAYCKEVVAYERYLQEQQQYNKQYQAYREYLSLLDSYNKELEIYNEQTNSSEFQTAIYQLSILRYLNTPVTNLKRTLFDAITGGAVTQVLAEKETLVSVGKVEGRAVDLAASATVALRELLQQYDKYENDDDRYVFYILCKEELSKNMNDLLRALDFLYNEYPIVRKVINQMDKKPQFEILLAQLYCMCNALSNEPIPNYIMVYKGKNALGAGYFDSTYRIGDDKKTILSILGNEGVLEDKNNAEPLKNGVPHIPSAPVKPEEVENPIAPKKVNEPIKPDVVERPDEAPKKVNEPIMPEKVAEPIMPVEYRPTNEEIELSEAYESGVLTERPLYGENLFYRAKSVVQKYFRNVRIATVYFYDGQTPANLLYVLDEVELGSYVEYPLSYPKTTKRGYTCTFDGWVDENGVFVDLNRFSVDKSDVYLYPHFKETPNMYRVNWRIDSKTTFADECAFGEKPVYDNVKFGEVRKEKNGLREYRFIGWKKGDVFYGKEDALDVMTDISVTYEAVFEESFIVTFMISGMGESVSYWEGETLQYESIPKKNSDSLYVYRFKEWDKPFEMVDKDITYTAVFENLPFVEMNTVSGISAGIVTTSDNFYLVNCQGSISSDYVVETIFDIANENGMGVVLNISGANISFSPSTVAELYEKELVRVNVYFANTAKYKYKFSIFGYDACDNEITLDVASIDLCLYGQFDEENSFLYEINENGETRDIRYSIADGKILFSAHTGYSYRLESQKTVGVIPSDYVEISSNVTRAASGDKVSVIMSEPPKGMYIESVYVISENGENIDIWEDNTFEMPNCAVNVGAVCSFYEYTVTFMSDGKVISVRSYRYGDKVLEPTATYKANDDNYSYTFIGWDKVVSAVEGDALYNAVYESKPIIRENIILETTKLTRLLHLAYILIPIVLVVIIAIITLIIVFAVKKRKKKKMKQS